MATAAKLRTLGFGIEAGRSKGDKYPQNRGDCRRNQNIDQGFSLGKAHTHLRLEGGRQAQALQGVSLTAVPEARHGNQNGRGASAPDAPMTEEGRTTLSGGAGCPKHLCSKIKIISKLSSQSSSRSGNLWRDRRGGPPARQDRRPGTAAPLIPAISMFIASAPNVFRWSPTRLNPQTPGAGGRPPPGLQSGDDPVVVHPDQAGLGERRDQASPPAAP